MNAIWKEWKFTSSDGWRARARVFPSVNWPPAGLLPPSSIPSLAHILPRYNPWQATHARWPGKNTRRRRRKKWVLDNISARFDPFGHSSGRASPIFQSSPRERERASITGTLVAAPYSIPAQATTMDDDDDDEVRLPCVSAMSFAGGKWNSVHILWVLVRSIDAHTQKCYSSTKAIWVLGFLFSHLFFAPISTGPSPLLSKMNLELKIARFRFLFLLEERNKIKKEIPNQVAAAQTGITAGFTPSWTPLIYTQECRVNEIKGKKRKIRKRKRREKTNRDVVFGWMEFHSINEITDVNFQRWLRALHF